MRAFPGKSTIYEIAIAKHDLKCWDRWNEKYGCTGETSRRRHHRQDGTIQGNSRVKGLVDWSQTKRITSSSHPPQPSRPNHATPANHATFSSNANHITIHRVPFCYHVSSTVSENIPENPVLSINSIVSQSTKPHAQAHNAIPRVAIAARRAVALRRAFRLDVIHASERRSGTG